MNQVVDTWNALTLKKKALLVGATLAIIGALYFLGRMAAQPSMSLLYAGLENSAAGDVVRSLEQRAIPYEIRGDSIFVPGHERDQLRLTLASEGLPANSMQGYELLDSLTGFGTTSKMFDAAYWRAKEGELARTIVTNPAISAARVHIASAQSNPFRREVGATASVYVTSVSGTLSAKQAKALRFLVASAVPGLDPDDVAIVDSVAGLVQGSDEKAVSNGDDEKSSALKDRVTRLIEARVGRGNAVVEVAVETVTESESIRERIVDPTQRVAISTDTEERANTSNEAGGGDVTVASNIPNGDAGNGESSTQTSESRERVNYEVSETEREITRAPGAIKRLTVAVLVNGQTTQNPDGTEAFEPLPDEELTALRDLVASAVGFEESRGDVITIKSMAFEPAEIAGTAATSDFWSALPFNPLSLIQMAVVALVALILGLFVVRPIFTRQPSDQMLALPAAPDNDFGAAANREEDVVLPEALTGEIDDGSGEFAPIAFNDAGDESNAYLPAVDTRDSVERLREAIDERREETVEILRGWLDESEERV